VVQDVNNPLMPILSKLEAIVVNEHMFFDFVRLQTPLVFIMFLYAGSGMICNDFRNNLMEVYFSKPLTWRDYTLGKIMTLVTIGLAVTAVPAIFLVVLHNALLPSMELFQTSYWWPLSILGFSLVIILPCALGILAASALLNGQNYAAIAVFMVIISDSILSGILAGLLQNLNYLALSFPLTLNRIGQRLFDDPRLIFSLRWEWSFLFVAVVCLWSVWVIARKVRRAEVAA
jgi:ABC-type transport system involved in multi-copper enzyme maturation permease subunit